MITFLLIIHLSTHPFNGMIKKWKHSHKKNNLFCFSEPVMLVIKRFGTLRFFQLCLAVATSKSHLCVCMREREKREDRMLIEHKAILSPEPHLLPQLARKLQLLTPSLPTFLSCFNPSFTDDSTDSRELTDKMSLACLSVCVRVCVFERERESVCSLLCLRYF